jgi:HEAT repeat protein
MSLESLIESVSNPDATIANAEFIEVSDLSPSELGIFARGWFQIPVERQQWVVTKMVDLAEENPELDFCAIFKMCLKDRNEAVVEKAIEGLWECEDRSVIPSLIQILQSPKGARVRSAAAVGLGKFSVLIHDGKLLERDRNAIHESLMSVLANDAEDLEVRRRCLEAVAPFNTPDIKQYVCWAYQNEYLKLKSSSIYAMGRTGETSWIPLLVKELQSREPTMRYETANACGELGDEEIVPHLIPLIQDDDYLVQVAGVSALGKIGGPLAKRALLRCIKEGDAALEEAARAALENVEFMDDPMAFISDV